MKPFRYFVPTDIHFGAGALSELPEVVRPLGKKPLLVTGHKSARLSGTLDKVEELLPQVVFLQGISQNPTVDACAQGAKVCRETGCDVVIGLGGGSSIDAAKAISVLATNPGDPRQYVGADKYSNPNLPVIAVPTTAGTGSEVTQYSVLVDTVENSKRTMSGRTMFPEVAILDPELSIGLPRNVTANTGLDALSQAMEGYVSKRSTPPGDVLALETCRIIRQWLPRAVDQPGDVEARGRMLYAAMLSGCLIAQSGTTLVHGMGYYFTLAYGLAHGLANALLLAPVFRYNARIEPRKVAELAGSLGHHCEAEPEEAAEKIGEAVHGLIREAGISPAGKDAGIEEGDLRGFAEHIVTDRPRFKNQIGEPGVEEVYGFFRDAWAGE